MKKKIGFLVFICSVMLSVANAQTDIYTTSGGEMIFSFATISDNDNEESAIMRWSPVFNMQIMVNADFSQNFGAFTGFAIRNVGYIYDDYVDPQSGDKVKKKFRTYNAGLPIGLKIGNLKKTFLYGGYEFEFPFHYKEKTFLNEKKDKFSVWFSDRVQGFQHGFLVGIQFKYGANLKFKYYMSGFHNQDFTETYDGVTYKPYENLESNIFYISLAFDVFKNTKWYYNEYK